jgi:hypothetical protein
MIYRNDDIGAAFELPDDPDFESLTIYDATLKASFNGRDELPTAEYCGAVVFAAAEAGLIGAWDVKSRPGVPLSNHAKQSGRAIVWAARCIERYIQDVRRVDPKSLAPWSLTPEMKAT